MNMAILAGRMQGYQGAPRKVSASVSLFLDGQSEIPDNHDTESSQMKKIILLSLLLVTSASSAVGSSQHNMSEHITPSSPASQEYPVGMQNMEAPAGGEYVSAGELRRAPGKAKPQMGSISV
ncbi:TPA_asm: hypothetical protein GJG61_22050 [Salmonella enterica subsp. enterica serovar Enteritidis]|nr:hypothetical protein [Salmonella enterica subsp. enterica serovar Kisarawe]HAB3395724.1 hypothetical protein [Salmonella enterica subsp. enterica serovar Enteritidis]